MTTGRRDDRDALLHALEAGLEQEAGWRPGAESGEGGALPGRRPGEALASRTAPVTGARALIQDCGTSRREGRTHVLLLSESATALSAEERDRLAVGIAAQVGAEALEWEGAQLLHLTAPGQAWEAVLRGAREAAESQAGDAAG